MSKASIIFLSVNLIFIHFLFAQKTEYPANRLYLSISAGYNSNAVYGSKLDRTQKYNNLVNLGKPEFRDRDGFSINVLLQKSFARTFYIKSGVSYIQKKTTVDNTIWVYKDYMSTSYLSVPVVILGANCPLNDQKTFDLFFEIGPVINARIGDKSYNDEWGLKASFISVSLIPATGLSYSIDPKHKLFFQYSYIYDITASHKQLIYEGVDDPNHKYIYKFKTQSFALGLQWSIK